MNEKIYSRAAAKAIRNFAAKMNEATFVGERRSLD